MPCGEVEVLVDDIEEIRSQPDDVTWTPTSQRRRRPQRERFHRRSVRCVPAQDVADRQDADGQRRALQLGHHELRARMFARQEGLSIQVDGVYKRVSARLDSHATDISRLHTNLPNLSEKIDSIELVRAAAAQFKDVEANFMNKFEVMEKEPQRKYEQAPSQPPGRPGGPAATADVDILAIGGFRQDTPKAQVLKVFEKVVRPKMAQRFDLTTWEAFCPYLLSSVCSLRAPTPALARQAVSFLRSSSLKVKLNGEELSLWSTIQKTCEQKDRARRLMRLASYVQTQYIDGMVAAETYKLICWRSGTVVVFDRRIARQQEGKLAGSTAGTTTSGTRPRLRTCARRWRIAWPTTSPRRELDGQVDRLDRSAAGCLPMEL